MTAVADKLPPIQADPEIRGDPYRVLLVCQLLNRATGTVARRVLPEVLRRWPTARVMATADPEELAEALRPLGFPNRRARLLRDMARQMALGWWEHPEDLPGVGPYGADAYAIFVDGRLDVEPEDRVLRAWVRALREGAE
ncbi:MAG: hypothetical protein ACLFWG_00255 [Longimicrobiales bacterium]